MIIYKTTDRIPVKIGEVVIEISPLSASQYLRVIGLTKMKAGEEVSDPTAMALETIRYAVKSLQCNDTFADGSQLVLNVSGDGGLDEESLNCLLQVVGINNLSQISAKLLSEGIKQWDIPGVEVQLDSSTPKKSQ